uniref:ERCC4 domain-containing protein n=1 Tax=Leersia perrieri TaxID=77586 RepID=A0A0D9WAC4_9ORYZ
MASYAPVVEILDDDDDDVAAAPDFLDAFSPSPPDPKRRRQPASTIVLDDTPTPPKRRPPVAADRSASVAGDTPRSSVPCSLSNHAVADETPDTVLPRGRIGAADSATPGSVVPCSIGLDTDIVVPETPGMGFTTPRLAGIPAVPGLQSPAAVRKFRGVSCPISLDSDDELDDTTYREPLTKSPSNVAKTEHVSQPGISFCPDKVDTTTRTDQKDYSGSYVGCQATPSSWKNNGTTSHDQPFRANSHSEDSTLKEAHPFTNKHCPREENVLSTEERKKKQQEVKRLKKEEKARQVEERKQKQQETKMLKEAMKAEQAKLKKLEKERRKWESGKLATKCIVAEIDSSVIESGSVGGHLVLRYNEKEISYQVTSNSIRGSILWKMRIPDSLSQDQASTPKVPYILFVFQAEEFCDLVTSGTLWDHVQKVRSQYPEFTICYLTNKLMSYIKRRISTTKTRQIRIVGNVHQWKRKPMTWLSVNANGSSIPKGIDKERIKKSTWLKTLVAIPKVSPGQAIAIEKKYPSMRSLLNVHEKEILLKDLKLENHLGDLNRNLGPVCSKQVYTILMSQNGALEVEVNKNGA